MNWLITLLLVPAIGAVVVALLPKDKPDLAKQVALAFSIATLVLVIAMALQFDGNSTEPFQFVFSQHCKSCRQLGMSDEKIAAIAYWAASDEFSEVERLVLAYTDALALQGGRVPDQLVDALKRHLDDLELLELTYITSLYIMHAIMSRALRTEWDDRDDPIVEIAGPDGFSGYDVGAAISGTGG